MFCSSAIVCTTTEVQQKYIEVLVQIGLLESMVAR